MIDFPEGARVVSYLPMAHIAERATGHYMPIVLGHTVTCCPNPREVIAYLPEVRPTWFFAVPRIWEKLKAGLEAMIESEQDEQRKAALKWALDVGHQKVRAEQAGEPVPAELAAGAREGGRDGAVEAARAARARRARGRLRRRRADAAARCSSSSTRSACRWRSCGACRRARGSGAVNLPGKIKLGTVGQVTPGMELKLAEDGEVLIRGPQIMKGYRNMPDKTAEAIDADGWLHTGDIGELDDDGYLKIVDRKKELIITAGGKNISPANLEAKLKAHPLIGTACVIGDEQPFLTRADRARPRRRARLGGAAGHRGHLARGAGARTSACGPRSRGRWTTSTPRSRTSRASRSSRSCGDGLAARRRRADADDEAEAQAGRRRSTRSQIEAMYQR